MFPMHSTLLFLRHAETDLAGTFCGATDPPLNERGIAQLPALLHSLADLRFDAIYTSDLLRARQTAEALAAGNSSPIHLRAGLRQINFGDWETLTWEQIESANPAFAARWVAEFPNLTPPNGEPIAQFKHRVVEEIGFIRQQTEGQTVAIVTHSTVLRVLLEEFGHFAPHHAWERTRAYTCTVRATQHSPTGVLTFA
jgi:alpha-ribazole phosphatase/probable phosphoglycerate mutase